MGFDVFRGFPLSTTNLASRQDLPLLLSCHISSRFGAFVDTLQERLASFTVPSLQPQTSRLSTTPCSSLPRLHASDSRQCLPFAPRVSDVDSLSRSALTRFPLLLATLCHTHAPAACSLSLMTLARLELPLASFRRALTLWTSTRFCFLTSRQHCLRGRASTFRTSRFHALPSGLSCSRILAAARRLNTQARCFVDRTS